MVDEPLLRRLEELFRDGVRRHGLAISLELRDLQIGKLTVNTPGDFRYTDEEGINDSPRGLGVGKLLANAREQKYWHASR